VTSVQNAGGSAEELASWDELRQANELKLRIYNAVPAGPDLTEAELDALEPLRQKYADDPLLKAGAIKLMADGVVETNTAAMLEPYANTPVTGLSAFTPEALTRIVTMLDARGWQVWIHAVGDRAVRMSLDAFEAAAKTNPAPARGRRHRIEHIESSDPADIPRFGRLGVIASMQPFRADAEPGSDTLWSFNLGSERAERGWMWGSIVASGGRLAFGSDWPEAGLDPRPGLQVAVNRHGPAGEAGDGSIPSEQLQLTAAIDAYTSGPAYASFDEQRKGTLARGMLADIVVLTADVFDAPPERLLDAHVAVTIFDGKIVYERANSTTE
jgi:predicted amidohydrolase YtcJ